MVEQAALEVASRYAPYCTRSSDAIEGDLKRYADLLEKWQTATNLVSRETLPALWSRHFADSLQLLKLLREEDRSFVDLGSGGGFPAIPLAIALADRTPVFTLVEANARKASFLRTVARELRLSVAVMSSRIEQIDSRETNCPDIITSRALAPLPELFTLASRFFGHDTRAILHKGREYPAELTESRVTWEFDVLIVESDVGDGVLLEIRNLRSKSAR